MPALTQMNEWLWTGSFPEAIDEAWKQHRVAFETIINVSDSPCNSVTEKSSHGCDHFWFPVFECGKWDYASFYGTKRAIDGLKKKKGRESDTLIHCHAGAYRSPIVAASYLYSIGELPEKNPDGSLNKKSDQWWEFTTGPRSPEALARFMKKMNEFSEHSICGILRELGEDIVKKNCLWEHKVYAEDVLRSLASSLGVGGYNADFVDPEAFGEKIQWGIEEMLKIQYERGKSDR